MSNIGQVFIIERVANGFTITETTSIRRDGYGRGYYPTHVAESPEGLTRQVKRWAEKETN